MRLRSAKVVFMGLENTGKTSLIRRILENIYDQNEPSTIGAAFNIATIKNIIKLDIWDTAGHRRYDPLLPMHYRNAAIALLAFCDKKSFERIKGLTAELQTEGSQELHIIIVRTKSDTAEAQQVSDTEVTDFQKEKNIPICLLSTSAKQNTNCDTLFKTILALPEVAASLHLNVMNPLSPQTEVTDASISLHPYKNSVIDTLAQYISTKRNNSSFDLSKEAKISAAMKTIACFFGADVRNLNFSHRERAALLEGDLKNNLNRKLNALGIKNIHTFPLLRSLEKTSNDARKTQNKHIYIDALLQFLTIYRDTRNQNPKMHYFFSTGCSKTHKISAVNKLIAQLSATQHTSSSFTPEEITALNDGALKKTIQTTLRWFSSDGAPTFETFMEQHCTEKEGVCATTL